jgi:hypothetical protein
MVKPVRKMLRQIQSVERRGCDISFSGKSKGPATMPRGTWAGKVFPACRVVAAGARRQYPARQLPIVASK